jgi:hypothetical protein
VKSKSSLFIDEWFCLATVEGDRNNNIHEKPHPFILSLWGSTTEEETLGSLLVYNYVSILELYS